MADSGEGLLPFLYPDFYAKQLPIQRQRALAQALMQQGMSDPGTARYGGLRNAGSMLAGALLGRYSDNKLGQLYSGPENPGAGQDTGQVSNAAQPVQGNVEQPYEGTDSTNLFPELHNNGTPPQQTQAAPPAAPREGLMSGIRGLDKRESMLMFMTDPGKYFETIAQQHGPTELMRNIEAAFPNNPAAQQNAYQQWAQKQTQPDAVLQSDYAAKSPLAGGLSGPDLAFIDKLPPEVKAIGFQAGFGSEQFKQALAQLNAKNSAIPLGRGGVDINGQILTPPSGGIGIAPYRPGETPQAFGIPGYAQANAGVAGAQAAATEPEKIINVTRSDGSVVPMRAGNATGQAQQPQLFGARNPQGGYQPVPGAAPGIGQSTAQAQLQQHIGTEAAADAKFQSSADTALANLDRLEAINDKTPDSTWADPTVKADWARRIGKDNVTTNVQLWHTYNENGLAGAIEQIRNSGGSRIPQGLVEELKKARGIDIDDPPATRAANIQAMRQVIMDAKAASHNTVANMNAPDATTTTTRQPVGPREQSQAAPKTVAPAAGLPQAARAQLHYGVTTTFKNGQKWTLQNGQPVRVQ